jgi:hypothetical protein
MKLIGHLSEFSINERYLTCAEIGRIKELVTNNINLAIEVKEYKLRVKKRRVEGKEVIIHPDSSLRHQVRIIIDTGIAKIFISSLPMNYISVEALGLTPIDSVKNKERSILALRKLSDAKDSKSLGKFRIEANVDYYKHTDIDELP